MLRWISKLPSRKIGGFAWWKSLGLVTIGALMALGMSLRYGDPSKPVLIILIVLAGSLFAVAVLWWSSNLLNDTTGSDENDEG